MKRVTTFAEARRLRKGRVGFVATMGFFHEGHVALMEAARRQCDTLMASIFVNPLQFGDPSDLASYPRDVERDATLAAAAGVDVLFLPSVEEMYPDQPTVRLTLDALTMTMEGAHRPGHFDGVAIAVAKLFAGLQPDVACFGRKDAQQLAVVRRLVRDLSFPVEIVGMPIVRDHDGLALSSRNIRLSGPERRAATVLYRALQAAATSFEGGERDPAVLEDTARQVIDEEPLVALEYAEVADASDLVRLRRVDRDSFLAVAAAVGEVRLIDNCFFLAGTPELGECLARPSSLDQGDR